MANYEINLGIRLDNNGLQNIRNQINALESNPINLQLNDRDLLNRISNIRQQIQQLGNVRLNLGGSGSSNIGGNFTRNINNNVSQIITTTNNASHTIQRLRQTLASAKFDNASIDLVTQHLQQMDLAVTNVTSRIRNNNLRLNITGVDELGRTVTVLKEMNLATGEITNIGKNISQSFGRTREEAQRTNAAYREMKSIIKEIGSVTIDINKAREAGQSYDALGQKLISLQSRYEQLEATFASGFDNNQTRNLAIEWEKLAHSVDIANEKMSNISAQQRQNQATKELKKSYQDLLNMANQISNLEAKIGKLKLAGGNVNQIEVLENKLKSLKVTYDSLANSFVGKGALTSGVFDVGDIDKLNNAVNQGKAKLNELEAEYEDTRAKLARKLEVKLESGKFSAEVSKVNADAKKLSGVTGELKQKLNALNSAESAMNSAFKNGSVEQKIQAYNRYKVALESVKNQLKQNQIAEQSATNTVALNQAKQNLSLKMSNWLRDNSAAAKQFGGEIKNLDAQLKTCGNMSQVKNISKAFDNITLQAKAAGVATQSLGDKIKAQFSKYSSYFSVASVFMYTTRALRSMFEQVKLIDSAMTELKKVTNETAESYNQFLSNSASVAKEVGTTIDGIISSTADFARLGYNFADSQGLAKVANIYAVVGDEVEGVEGATESLISTMAAFKDEMSDMSNTDFAMSITDKFNEIGNKFSITSGGIGEAMKRSASSLDAANNSIDESIALITAANTVVQDPDKVGRLLPTIKVAISVKLQRWTRPSKDFIYNF